MTILISFEQTERGGRVRGQEPVKDQGLRAEGEIRDRVEVGPGSESKAWRLEVGIWCWTER